MGTYKQYIGDAGEQAAVEYLHGQGFELLHRNWRRGRLELDIVVRRGEVLHFVEVKTRRQGGLTSPEDAITHAKATAVIRAAQAYLAEFGLDAECQFDVVAVEHSPDGFTVRYIPDAIVPSW